MVVEVMKLLPCYANGPVTRTTDADVFWILHYLSGSERIGRKKLADTLDIGEGSMRNVMKVLNECGLVEIFQTGIIISEAGRELLAKIPIIPIDVKVPGSVIGKYQESIIVKDVGYKISNGWAQRDVGVRTGSLGCTTIVHRDGNLMIPPDWNLDIKAPMQAKQIRSVKEFTPSDAIIIGDANDAHTARNAAVTAALDII